MQLELNAEPSMALTLGGEPATVEEIKAAVASAAGSELLIGYGDHTLSLVDNELTINGAETVTIDSSAMHLDLNEMACCVGDKCLMWPSQSAAKPRFAGL